MMDKSTDLESIRYIDPDGIPIRRLPAPLARRFQQICATVVAEALSGAGVVQLEWAVLIFIDDVPGIDQSRLSQAMGIDRNSVCSGLSEWLSGASSISQNETRPCRRRKSARLRALEFPPRPRRPIGQSAPHRTVPSIRRRR